MEEQIRYKKVYAPSGLNAAIAIKRWQGEFDGECWLVPEANLQHVHEAVNDMTEGLLLNVKVIITETIFTKKLTFLERDIIWSSWFNSEFETGKDVYGETNAFNSWKLLHELHYPSFINFIVYKLAQIFTYSFVLNATLTIRNVSFAQLNDLLANTPSWLRIYPVNNPYNTTPGWQKNQMLLQSMRR